MTNSKPLFIRSIARSISFPLPLAGLLFVAGTADAQEFKPSSQPNVQVRSMPGTSVWPKTTRAANGDGRIPPTIVRDENGVKAVLNSSWMVTAKAKRSASGQMVINCDEHPGGHPHKHSNKGQKTTSASKKRSASQKKSPR